MATDMGGFAQAGGPVLVDQFGRPLKASAALNYRRDDLTATGGETVVEMTSPARNLKVYKNSTLLKLSEYTINSSVQFTLGSALALHDVLTVEYQSAYSQGASYLVPPTTDPSFTYVKSLLHFDGADGSTTFTDESGKIWTAHDNAQIDTAQSMFGGASGLFDGSGDFITTPNHADFDFGSGDFTLEAFVRPNNVTSDQCIISNWYGVLPGYCAFILYITSAGKLKLSYGVGGTNTGTPSSESLTAGAWQHVAACRQGDTVSYFIGGTKDATTMPLSGALNVAPGASIAIGAISPSTSTSLYMNGWLDEVRITKGVARYTSDFIPPTGPFPDS